jgi:hypothetical protein
VSHRPKSLLKKNAPKTFSAADDNKNEAAFATGVGSDGYCCIVVVVVVVVVVVFIIEGCESSSSDYRRAKRNVDKSRWQ